MGLRHHSPTPQGAAVVVVPSFDRHHDGGLAADNPYSTPIQIKSTTDLFILFTIDVTTMHGKLGKKTRFWDVVGGHGDGDEGWIWFHRRE
ncbi:hypothetical protein Tco_0843806 [Tanacetum coccineum]